MTTINCDNSLNIEHCDHTSVESNQSGQWPWVGSLNILLLCLLLCTRTPDSFCFQGDEDGQGGWTWHRQDWVDQVGVPNGSRQPSLQVLPTVCSKINGMHKDNV
jgi:hypothetical protein